MKRVRLRSDEEVLVVFNWKVAGEFPLVEELVLLANRSSL
jgi:hypothetical protein